MLFISFLQQLLNINVLINYRKARIKLHVFPYIKTSAIFLPKRKLSYVRSLSTGKNLPQKSNPQGRDGAHRRRRRLACRIQEAFFLSGKDRERNDRLREHQRRHDSFWR